MCLWYLQLCHFCLTAIHTKLPEWCGVAGCQRAMDDPNHLVTSVPRDHPDNVQPCQGCSPKTCGLLIQTIVCGHPKALRTHYCQPINMCAHLDSLENKDLDNT
jgi:hypothetical protein